MHRPVPTAVVVAAAHDNIVSIGKLAATVLFFLSRSMARKAANKSWLDRKLSILCILCKGQNPKEWSIHPDERMHSGNAPSSRLSLQSKPVHPTPRNTAHFFGWTDGDRVDWGLMGNGDFRFVSAGGDYSTTEVGGDGRLGKLVCALVGSFLAQIGAVDKIEARRYRIPLRDHSL